MSALGPGVRVKCIKQGAWTHDGEGPRNGSVWTISDIYFQPGTRDVFLRLVEWPYRDDLFLASRFIPLNGNEDLSELMSALNKGPVESEPEEHVRVVERVR
jgi:hypothetical protein